MDYEELSEETKVKALQQLEEELDKAQEESSEWEEKAKRIKADFENYKKKQDGRKEKWQHQAKEGLAEELIEVIDNLERAILSADEDSTLLQGVQMVADQLYDKLEEEGLERIDAEGEEFDPRLHKAVEKKEDGKKIIEEKRKGYMFGDKVLREAEVVVGKDYN
ncbi:MAG: nucleotide exchange factor GrpE [Candidatus Nanohaloarchaea archaeon]